MYCRGICIQYKSHKPVSSGHYATEQKHCRQCNLFIQWDGIWCLQIVQLFQKFGGKENEIESFIININSGYIPPGKAIELIKYTSSRNQNQFPRINYQIMLTKN